MGETTRLRFDILRQPNNFTCGPTCLHAVYRYYGQDLELTEVIRTAPTLPGDPPGAGTLAVMLGCDALRRGYAAQLVTFNLNVFDPTWFPHPHKPGDPALLTAKLQAQAKVKGQSDPKLAVATQSYLEFLERGGEILFSEPASRLISSHLTAGRPVLTGLSATYLYRCAREWGPNDDYDDIRGVPTGHFVVLCGYDPARRVVHVADPLEDNPRFASRTYEVKMSRLVGAIMLGVLTYDANLLVIEPKGRLAPGVLS